MCDTDQILEVAGTRPLWEMAISISMAFWWTNGRKSESHGESSERRFALAATRIKLNYDDCVKPAFCGACGEA